jgi:hypothetical protein
MKTEFKVVIEFPLGKQLQSEIDSAIKSAVLAKLGTLDLARTAKSDHLQISALRPNGGPTMGMIVKKL